MSFFIFNIYIKDIFQMSFIFIISSTGNPYSTHKTSSNWPYPVYNQILRCFSENKTKRQVMQLRHVQKRKFWLQITPGTECPPPNLLARDQTTGTWQAEDTDFSFTHLCITWWWQSAWTIFFIYRYRFLRKVIMTMPK